MLCEEIIGLADSVPNLSFSIDATLGDGGHAHALLKHNPHVLLMGIDCDAEMIIRARARLAEYHSRVNYVHAHYDTHLTRYGGAQAQFILFDLGISMTHITESKRGFTFMKDEPLDMRFDTEQKICAEHIVRSYSARELQDVFEKYGDERFARRIAAAICEYRARHAICSTGALVNVVAAAIPKKKRGGMRNPATKVFQALRIAVNDEIARIHRVLPHAVRVLEKGGVLATISFHSGEDRVLKHYFRALADRQEVDLLYKKVVVPGMDEVRANRAARSAKLRAIRKR